MAVGGRSDHARGALTHAVARKVVGGTPTLVSGTKYRNIDPLGRVLESRQTTGTLSDYTFLYQYAVGGALAKMRYPSGNWVSYDVNGANRIGKVRKGETGSNFYMQSAAYNPAGALTSATLGLNAGSQWTETRAYNSRLQARRVEVTKGANTLLRLRWAYSGAYNNTTLEETGTDNNGDLRVERLEFPHQSALQTVDRTYAYTGADRLSSFSETGGKSQSFGHDAFGNVWQTYVSGVPALRQTGASWYLQGGVVNNRLANTTYDAAGNQTQLSATPGTVASYDGENRMSKIAVGGSESASYVYDAEGRRVAKTVSGTTTYYFYDAAGQLMAEYGGPAQTAGTQYFTTDYLGSMRLILNGAGGCLDRLDYAPFGGQISRSSDCYAGASSEKPLFTGQMRDGESNAGTDTGQDYFNARYLWANTARFTSADRPFADQSPADGQSWNMYAYVRNNPLLYIDPSGTICVSPGGGNSDYDDSSIPGPSCAEIREEDKKWRGRYGATTDKPELRDPTAEQSAEHIRMQDEAKRRAQREAEMRKRDQELSQESKAVMTVAYYRTVHDLDCAGLGGLVTGGAGLASAPIIQKPFSAGGTSSTSVASTVLGGFSTGRSVPTPVGMPSTSGFAWRASADLGRIAGRYLPYVGLVIGASTTYACLSDKP